MYLQEIYDKWNIIDTFDKCYLAAIAINVAYDMGYEPEMNTSDDCVFNTISKGLDSYKVYILYDGLINTGYINKEFSDKIGLSCDDIQTIISDIILYNKIDGASMVTMPKKRNYKEKPESTVEKMSKEWKNYATSKGKRNR